VENDPHEEAQQKKLVERDTIVHIEEEESLEKIERVEVKNK
jgi:hypothetical protein